MNSRPILFKDEMIRAILEGRKTQTRRIIKPPRGFPKNSHCDPFIQPPAVWWWLGMHSPCVLQECPYGQIGDQLWVRESWRGPCQWGEWQDKFIYRADGPSEWPTNIQPPHVATWKPSIHMPRSASRITLEITDVRVERLQKISYEDAQAEGVQTETADPWFYHIPTKLNVYDFAADEPQGSFRKLWESINGPSSWNENPWVWVIEFKRV